MKLASNLVCLAQMACIPLASAQAIYGPTGNNFVGTFSPPTSLNSFFPSADTKKPLREPKSWPATFPFELWRRIGEVD